MPSTNTKKYRTKSRSSSGLGFGEINTQHKQSGNIMHDRRVIRGSTFQLRRSVESRLNELQNGATSTQVKTKHRRKIKLNDVDKENETSTVMQSESPPPPVSGRLHAEIQTDAYLEKIYVRTPEKEFGVQTDPFLDRPSTPLFIPKPSGPSVATQIEAGDLFDFDQEVEPILEVLIGKCIEQSLLEVLEEQELKAYAKYQAQFEQKRNLELAQCQRLEEEQRRKQEEKQRRIEQAEAEKERQQRLKTRIEAQQIAADFLQNIECAVFDELEKRGHFYDPVEREIECVFLPKLLSGVELQVQQCATSQMLIDDILLSLIQNCVRACEQNMQACDEFDAEQARQQKYAQEMKALFVAKRKEFTQAIKTQRSEFDFKQQIMNFLAFSAAPDAAVPAVGAAEVEETDALEPNAKNEEFLDSLIQQFNDEEQPLWQPVQSVLDKIGGDDAFKIERIESFLQAVRVNDAKKQLLKLLETTRENEEELKQVIVDCLGVDTFEEELYSEYITVLQGEDLTQKMNVIDELLKEKENIQEFITDFVQRKEEQTLKDAQEQQQEQEPEQEEPPQ
eukprot:CAMPEP_0202688110 /NCGR_PEP_ID=MMETSP1385-20130828/3646_1 /ASSEMBLY_ACC=CAM_ASM_000861 /TAXON_ID=933848 /ORGANISM="Elphidium margaritaceum" /LENGTH=562 /DNA_ID=CAMNT_0049343005 /DNA_START=82 /DNA_END=1770 /DNA_ORIENTATION=+